MAQPILVLNGPNLNLLGTREPEIYGRETLDDVEKACIALGKELGVAVTARQSNHEGELVAALQNAGQNAVSVIFNPGAYSHTSIALRDAISGAGTEVIEVHISNVYTRESFRHHSFVSGVAKGVIAGFGTQGYLMAIRALART